MSKQIGERKITGTIAGITFYKMEGEYYARLKSSLDGNRVKRDPRFKRTMEWAHRLARGSQLASKAYRSLPRVEQVYALYKELKSLAIRALKEGQSEQAVIERLQQMVGKEKQPLRPVAGTAQRTPLVPTSFFKQLFQVQLARSKEFPFKKRRRFPPAEVRRE